MPEDARATCAAAALQHRAAGVRVAAIALVARGAANVIETAGPLLEDGDGAVRLAAAAALAACSGHEEVADLFLSALERSDARHADRAELIALHRALGRLGTEHGFRWLVRRLFGGRRKLFKKPSEGDQLLAVQGLVAEGSARAADVLEGASEEADRSPPKAR